MPLSRSERPWAWFGAAGLAVALVVAVVLLLNRARDRQVAREVEAEVARALAALPADDPIIRRYGSFVRLEGEGYQRNVHALGLPTLPFVLDRKAIFSRASADVSISVHRGPTLRIGDFTMKPDLVGKVGWQAEVRDGEIWMMKGSESQRGFFLVQVNHPWCP